MLAGEGADCVTAAGAAGATTFGGGVTGAGEGGAFGRFPGTTGATTTGAGATGVVGATGDTGSTFLHLRLPLLDQLLSLRSALLALLL